jgi:hypothetical protein
MGDRRTYEYVVGRRAVTSMRRHDRGVLSSLQEKLPVGALFTPGVAEKSAG